MCVNKYKKMVANKEYGDFGFIQMIKNIAGYVLALAGIIVASIFLLQPVWERIKHLFLIKFNILPYLLNINWKFNLINFLFNDFRLGFLIIFIFVVGFLFFYLAHLNAKEKMMKFGLIALVPYFAFYYLLKGIILIISLFEFTKRGKKLKW